MKKNTYLSLLLLVFNFMFFCGCNKASLIKENEKKYLQINFKYPFYSFQLLKHMSYSTSGAADLGECLYIAQQIQEGNNVSWNQEWEKIANRTYSFAQQALSQSNLETAKEAFFRSSNYFLAAEFFLPKSSKKIETFEKARESFIKASNLCHFTFQQIKIPYENTYLPGYIYLANTSKPTKTIILNTGYDGNSEELYFGVGYFARKRGYNIVVFDGPGQGLTLRKQNLSFLPNWEKVIQSVINYTLSFKEVNPNQIALYGRSFGGYLAPKAAAYEKRIKALIVNSPIINFSKVMEKQGLPVKLAKENPQEFNKKIYEGMEKSEKLKFFINEGMWKLGGTTPIGWFENLEKYHLEKEIEMIECPTLVVDSEEDNMIDREEAKTFYRRLKCPKKMILFTKETGTALHCQIGAPYYANEVIFDWLDELFRKK